MKKLIYILVSLSFIACKQQKSAIEYRYINKTDTLIKNEIKTIYKGITDTITIDNPCDSTGIINHFYSKLVLPNGTITIRSERDNSKLKAFIKIDDAISNIKSQEKSRSSENIVTRYKEIIKYRIPQWAIITILVESLIILLYLYIKIYK